jgi:hypothetical protein
MLGRRRQSSQSPLVFRPDSPAVDHVGPVLQHSASLLRVLCLVVDGANTFLLMS